MLSVLFYNPTDYKGKWAKTHESVNISPQIWFEKTPLLLYPYPIMLLWLTLLTHLAWLLGLALVFTSLNYYGWLAQVQQRAVWQVWQEINCQRPVWLGFIFISLGLAGSSSQIWEIGLWLGMTAAAGWQLWQLIPTNSASKML